MNHLRTEGFRKPTRIDDALRILLQALGRPAVRLETIPLESALGRYLAEDLVSTQLVPPVDSAVMDGYAVRSEDVKNASQEKPVILDVIGESRLGEECHVRLAAGKAVAVATGVMMPAGADALAIVEHTAKLPGNKIAVHAPAALGQSISHKGQDVTPGTTILNDGALLRAQDLGILRRLGKTKVRVKRKPRVAILSTGNELVDSPGKGGKGKTVDINRVILSAMLQESGALPVGLGIVRDEAAQIKARLRLALKKSDMVLVTAGSSVGKRDMVPACVNALGRPGMLVHGVAMRPAMPTGLGVVNGKPILSLPGFPVSAMFAFRAFARPLAAWLMGVQPKAEPTVKAILKERAAGVPGLMTFVRVVVKKHEEGLVAEPLGHQMSSLLMSMVAANGIVMIPEGASSIEAGQTVQVSLIGEISN